MGNALTVGFRTLIVGACHADRLLSLLSIAILALPLLLSPTFANADSPLVEVELITDYSTVLPGQQLRLGVRLNPPEPWKIYWRNPGDAGLPTRVDWRLPAGEAGETRWPLPHRFEYQGLVSLGYGSEAVLLTTLGVPEDLQAGMSFHAGAGVTWLACSDICVQGSRDLSLDLPVAADRASVDPAAEKVLDDAEQRVPRRSAGLTAEYTVSGGRMTIDVRASEALFSGTRRVSLFPLQADLLPTAPPQDFDGAARALRLMQPLIEGDAPPVTPFDALLVLHRQAGDQGYLFTASAAPPVRLGSGPMDTSDASVGLGQLLLLATLGGLLLNLMPCVFPVLSLKAIKLVEAGNRPQREQRIHGISYTLGVMSFFCLVAALLLLLRAAGSSVGWGFQLQTPWFVALLVYLLVVLGMSFSGLLQIGGAVMGMGDTLTRRAGYSGSFFTGALAAVVASPCTAPFMGGAIAFALTQPPLYANLVFMALAMGMASPFLLLAFLPSLGRLLPRPGAWMETFKQAMAFPLYLTATWLLWVLGRETDPTTMALVLVGVVLILFAGWLQRRAAPGHRSGRYLKRALMVTALSGALLPFMQPALLKGPGVIAQPELSFWQPYSEATLASLRAENRPVFVNMTADWCISCIANERVALSMPSVKAAFEAKGIVPLKGDWTNNDPAVTRVLDAFNRSGVPLYILYPRNGAEPRLLPQWLTPFNLLAAFESI